jgi:hypothetical protein
MVACAVAQWSVTASLFGTLLRHDGWQMARQAIEGVILLRDPLART